jgi:hypothetical protein
MAILDWLEVRTGATRESKSVAISYSWRRRAARGDQFVF